MVNYTRQDAFLVTVVVDGEKLGIFDKSTGGKTTAQDTKFRPGGGAREQGLGGPQSVENVTTERGYDPARDAPLAKRLRTKVGFARVTVSKQPLDRSGVPLGDPEIYSGTLLSVGTPDYDSNANSANLLSLEVSCDGSVG